MNVVVAIKKVVDTSEAADVVEVDAAGKDISKAGLVSRLNDWDGYALEEGLRWREKLGGTATALTVGPRDWDDVLRTALAMGADAAVRVDEDAASMDCRSVARILATAIGKLPHDLVLFGAQSEDFGSAQLGPMVAQMLGLPHATLVVGLDVNDDRVHVSREIEGGARELYTLTLPALLTIQTGLNRPRYVSFSRIKRAREKEIGVTTLHELGLSSADLVPSVTLERLELTPAGRRAMLISGNPEEAAGALATLLKESGVI
ncbi:MAG: electron transfer flavoprotein subunit beta/FixA family protein [Chloroflexota bacterium]|nr:electron transfer flavoprotein subunit beta/FixA family protein [Chloroflexota bacterium]